MDTTRAGKLTRLRAALEREYAALAPLRKQRARLISCAAGPNYPHTWIEDGALANLKDPLNLLRQAAQAEAISLAFDRPRALCSSPFVDRLPFVMTYENALNAYSKEMQLEEAFRAFAQDGFYLEGICKVYMAESVPIWLESNEWMDPGRPFVQNISFHHFVYDTGATGFHNCQFLADRYRVSFEDVITDTRFKASIRKEIKEKGPLTQQQIASTEPGRSLTFDETDIDPQIFLADVFVRRDSKVYTFVVNEKFEVLIDEPLAEIPWTTRETGPYHFYSSGPVPDKTTPSSTAQNLELLHNGSNSLYRTLVKQAEEQRTVLLLDKTMPEDQINAIRDAEDLHVLAVENPALLNQLRTGGPDQQVFAFLLNMLEQFDTMAGNLKFRLGTGASADTNGQEQLIAGNVSRAEGYTRMLFIQAIRGIYKELARLLFESKTTKVNAQRRIDDYVSVDDPWTGAVEEGSRMGEFSDYDIDIDPTPMEYKAPGQRVMELTQTFQELLPLAPLTMQQGKMPDVDYYLKEKARLLGNSCLERLLVSIVPPEEQPGGGGHERSMVPSGPNGNYTHTSTGSGSGSGQGGNEQLAMMSAGAADNAA